MSKGPRVDWRKAPLAPYVAIVVKWEAFGSGGGPDHIHGHSWMGWIARPPADWDGALERLAAHAPKGASASFAISPDGKSCSEAWAPVRPAGLRAPWLESSETAYDDLASPRVAALIATWGISAEIPSVWSDAWHARMTRMALDERMGQIGAELERIGFGRVECLGIQPDVGGEMHWCAVAARAGAGWEARALALDLEEDIRETGERGRSKAL